MHRIPRIALRTIRLPIGARTSKRFASTSSIAPTANNGDWPWRTVSSDSSTGKIVQARTIYSRPLNFRPRTLWIVFLAVVPGCFIAADTVRLIAETQQSSDPSDPSLSPQPTPSSAELTRTRRYLKWIRESFNTTTILPAMLMSAGGALTILILYLPTRSVRRLTQMRQVWKNGQGKEKDWVRMETAAMGMWWGRWGEARDIERNRMSVGLIRGGTTSTPFLKLMVQPTSTISLDKQSYRLDFRKILPTDYPAETLSVSRAITGRFKPVKPKVEAMKKEVPVKTPVTVRKPKRDGLTLQHFLLRTEILKSYRSAVRSTRVLPDSHTRRETLDWLRVDLERLKTEADLAKIKDTLGAFKRNYKQFQPSLGLSSAGLDSGSKLVGRKRDGMVDKEKMITESESLKLVLEKKAEEEKDEEIDLGDSGDVVVSWKRIEQVFGTVR